MNGKDITIKAKDGGSFSGYLSTPKSGKGPAVVVIQEIFGVNAGLRHICDAYAAHGFFAISPDIFWRQEPGVQLSDQTEAEWKKAFELYQGFDVNKGIDDIKTTLAHIRHLPGSSGKAGVTGYCLGGKLAYLMACRSDTDATVAYYGGGIDEHLNEAPKIKKPALLHFAEEDEYINKAAQQKIQAALKTNPLISMYFYPGVDHAFARVNGQHYDKPAADLANKRTAEFFAAHLK
jgi:carboxymethylenebutenolidase